MQTKNLVGRHFVLIIFLSCLLIPGAVDGRSTLQTAPPAPLYRDPVFDGAGRKAVLGVDEAGRPVSWITVTLSAGEKAIASAAGSHPEPRPIRRR